MDSLRPVVLLAEPAPTRRRPNWPTPGSTSSCRTATATRSAQDDASSTYDAYDLLMVETRDALGNRVTVRAPTTTACCNRASSAIPNRNRTEVAFDTLGMVVGTAVMGKPLPAPVEGDSLTGFVADLTQAQLDAFFDSRRPAHQLPPALLQGRHHAHRLRPRPLPPHAAGEPERPDASGSPPAPPRSPARPTSATRCRRRVSRSSSASPTPTASAARSRRRSRPSRGRWSKAAPWSTRAGSAAAGPSSTTRASRSASTSRSSATTARASSSACTVGVSPMLFYDPVERVVATLHPNHTYEKVVFDPWQQTTWDVNDTVLRRPRNRLQTGDPRTDPDIGGYVAEYLRDCSPPTVADLARAAHRRRARARDERRPPQRAAAHADTPTTAHFDALGRPFLTVAHNSVVCAGHELDRHRRGSFATRVELDIEGNQRAVRDAIEQDGDPLGRIVMRYDYDMLGNRIHQLSMEAGERWMLNDVAGKPIRAWDSRGHNFRTTYDALRRPIEQTVRGTDDASVRPAHAEPRHPGRQDRVRREHSPTPKRSTCAASIYRHFDSAGVVTNARLDANGNPIEAYDFKGNLLRSTRQLAQRLQERSLDWLAEPATRRRDLRQAAPATTRSTARSSSSRRTAAWPAQHKLNVIQPVFNEANLLERVDV